MSLLWSDAASGIQVVQRDPAQGTSSYDGPVDKLLCLFEQIAGEEGWQPGNAIRADVARSTYFALTLHGQLAGGLQLILPRAGERLPCFAVWPDVEQALSSPAAAHIAILALAAPHRGRGLLFWHLAIEMWRFCVGHGITTVFIEVTPRVLPLYQRLGWPLLIRGGLRVHWGEPCYLCSLGVAEVAEAILRRAEHSDYYRQIIAQAFRLAVLPILLPPAHAGVTRTAPLREAAV